MWETYGFDNEDLLWPSTALFGGIAGQQQATCGAATSGAVCLGLRLRQPLADEPAVKRARSDIEREAAGMAREFTQRFGTLVCRDLVGLDLSDPEVRRRFQTQNLSKDTCDRFVSFVIDKLYQLEATRDLPKV
jgi:hypothetical protein